MRGGHPRSDSARAAQCRGAGAAPDVRLAEHGSDVGTGLSRAYQADRQDVLTLRRQATRPRQRPLPRLADLREHASHDLGRLVSRQASSPQHVHRGGIAGNIRGPVDVARTGELLGIHRIRQLVVGEAQDRESRRTQRRPGRKLPDPDRDSGPPGSIPEMPELGGELRAGCRPDGAAPPRRSPRPAASRQQRTSRPARRERRETGAPPVRRCRPARAARRRSQRSAAGRERNACRSSGRTSAASSIPR